ncbi:MAG: 4Fe-4S binding protein [Clostridia bacterium]|nr:4Fe-4S binding protein [Clostridia bacterium]
MKNFFGKIKNWFKNHIPTRRRIIQVYTALLYNANIKGFFNGQLYKGPTKNLCVPGMNCYSCPGATGACPLGSLQNALLFTDKRTVTYIFGILILFGLLLGRTICGFLCPIGLFQELLYKIKTPKLKKSRATRVLSYFKYVMLFVLVVIVPLTFAIPGFCEYICPAGTFEGGIFLLLNKANESLLGNLGPLFTWKFTLLILIAVGSIFVFRLFCRFLCPLGAIYGFFSKIALLGIKLDKTKCNDCGLCVSACKMDIKKVGDHECIHCGECISVCPVKAISWKGSHLFVRGDDTTAPAAIETVKPLNGLLKPAQTAQNDEKTSLTKEESAIAQNLENAANNAEEAAQ